MKRRLFFLPEEFLSIDRAVRELIQQEMDAQLRPLQADLDALRGMLERLGGVFSGVGVKARRGPVPGALAAGRRGRRTRAEDGANDRPCALIGCKRDARAKG